MKLSSLFSLTSHRLSTDGKWLLARPQTSENTFLIPRIKAAFRVLTGKSDVLDWDDVVAPASSTQYTMQPQSTAESNLAARDLAAYLSAMLESDYTDPDFKSAINEWFNTATPDLSNQPDVQSSLLIERVVKAAKAQLDKDHVYIHHSGGETATCEKLLSIAMMHCNAVLTGKPDATEPITVVFSVQAWRKFSEELRLRSIAANELRELYNPLVVNAAFETTDGFVTGITAATVKRIEYHDDGSITCIIDHWPKEGT